MREIFRGFGDIKDQAVSSQAAQKQVAKLQDYISQNLYPCEMEILESLGLMYVSDQRFKETIDQMVGIGTATFVSRAISHYCQS